MRPSASGGSATTRASGRPQIAERQHDEGLGEEDLERAYHEVLHQDEWRGELTKRRKDGRRVTVESHLTLVRGDDGQPQSVLEIETDITQRKHDEHAILSLAFFDP